MAVRHVDTESGEGTEQQPAGAPPDAEGAPERAMPPAAVAPAGPPADEAAVQAVRAELEAAWLELGQRLAARERERLQRAQAVMHAMPWYGTPEQVARFEQERAALETADREASLGVDEARDAFLRAVGRQLAAGPRDRRLYLAISASLHQLALDACL